MSRERRISGCAAAALVAAAGVWAAAASAQENGIPAAQLRVGHWLEVKGELREDGLFHGEEAELKKPERHELLIGTVTSFDRARGRFELLGQPVVLTGSTEFDGLEPAVPGRTAHRGRG